MQQNRSAMVAKKNLKNLMLFIGLCHHMQPDAMGYEKRNVGCYATPLVEGGRKTLLGRCRITAPRRITWRQLCFLLPN